MPGLLDGPPDFTDQYNTKLPPEQEAEFQKWLQEQSAIKGYDASQDLFDYDLRGAYAAAATPDDRGHMTDQFKKPNHATFSTGSIYHNSVPGLLGGTWTERFDRGPESYDYAATPTNLRFRTKQQLNNYFRRVEPDSTVNFPEERGLGMRR